jgi:uncharacterized protein YggU (UPF0235/DUF167 family)
LPKIFFSKSPQIYDAGTVMAFRFTVIVRPNARKTALEPFTDFPLRVHVSAPAQENRANEALIRLLSKELDLPQRFFTILRGKTARQKFVAVEYVDEEDLRRRLTARGSTSEP